MSLAGCGKGQSCESWCQNFSNNIFKLLTSPCSFLHGNKISSILIGCFLQQCTLGIVFDFSRNVTTNRTIIEGTLHTIFSPKPLLYSINWWILTINNIYTLSDFFNFIQHYQLCSLGDANDANSCTKCLSGTNWLRLAWNLERELWNWSGVSDEGRLDGIPLILCLVLPVTWSTHSLRLYAFSKREPVSLLLYDRQWRQHFLFLPSLSQWEEGRISPTGSVHCCRLMKTSKSEKLKRHQNNIYRHAFKYNLKDLHGK